MELGNVYIADGGNNRVVEVPKSGGAQTTVGIGLSGPDAVAIDGIGNIFVTDHNNARVVLIPAGGGAQTTIGTGFIGPSSVAVDGAGNLYVGDFNGNDVVKVSIVGGAQTTIGTGILAPTGVAVDGAGNVYIAEGNGGASLQNQNVWEVSPIGVQTLIQNGTNSYAVAVDGSGNVLISENAQAVTELFQLGSFVELTYGTVGGAPGTASLPLTNFGTAPLTLARSITPSEFTESDNCGTSVAVNASCIVNLTFTPTSGIPYPGTAAVGTLILSDNAPYTPQTLTLYTLAITLPTQLVFSSPPIASLEPGGNAGAVSVSIEDAYGHVAADDPTPAITLSVTGPSGYAQSYGLDPALGPGFFNLSKSPLYTSGTYTYTATSNGLASATFIETVLPNSFTVPTEPTGQTSPSTAVTVAFSTISTLGTIKVVTQGITELDFQQAPTNSGSCAIGTTYGIGQSCTVNVLFAPKGVGLRMGAVLLYDNAATPNLVATAFLSGIGQAGLLSFSATPATLFSIANKPLSGLGLDSGGNVYFDYANNVVKVPAGGGTATTVASDFNGIGGLAVDGAGNIYFSANNTSLYEVAAGSTTATAIATGFISAGGVAVDGAGNVYVADFPSNRVVKIAAIDGNQTTVGTALFEPTQVAVDGAGNVYIAESVYPGSAYSVVEVHLDGGAQTTLATSPNPFYGLAVDGAGNVFITGESGAIEVPAGGGAQIPLATGLQSSNGVAIDGTGNLYFVGTVDPLTYGVVEVQRTQLPPTVSFGNATVGGVPASQTLSFQNIGNVPLSLKSAAAPSQYTENDTCGGAVAINANCSLNLTFTPTSGSPPPGSTLPGTLTLTDNAPASPQVINLTGTALLTALVPTLQPETEVYGQAFGETVTLSNITVGAATGTISFTAGGKILCTLTGTLTSAPITCNALDSGLSVGTHTVTFNYSGDSHYDPFTGSTTLTVTPATLAFTPPPETEVAGAPFPLILLFAGQGTSAPTGTVTFSNSGAQLCTTALNATAISANTITCSAPSNALAAGTYTISYAYSGDSNYAASSGTATLSVSASDVFAGSPPVPFPVTVPALAVTVPPTPPITAQFVCGTVSEVQNGVLTIIDPSKVGIGCSSAQFQITSAGAQQVQVSVTTAGSSSLSAHSKERSALGSCYAWVLPMPGLFLLGFGGLKGRRKGKQQAQRLVCLCVISILLFSAVACGGHFTPPQTVQTGGGAQVTPAGVYYVTVVDQPVSCVQSSSNCNVTGFVQTSLIVPLNVVATPK